MPSKLPNPQPVALISQVRLLAAIPLNDAMEGPEQASVAERELEEIPGKLAARTPVEASDPALANVLASPLDVATLTPVTDNEPNFVVMELAEPFADPDLTPVIEADPERELLANPPAEDTETPVAVALQVLADVALPDEDAGLKPVALTPTAREAEAVPMTEVGFTPDPANELVRMLEATPALDVVATP